MSVEATTQSICDRALRFGEDRKGGEEIMVRHMFTEVKKTLDQAFSN